MRTRKDSTIHKKVYGVKADAGGWLAKIYSWRKLSQAIITLRDGAWQVISWHTSYKEAEKAYQQLLRAPHEPLLIVAARRTTPEKRNVIE